MSATENTTSSTSAASWKKTASVVSLAVGGLLIAVGNFFGGTLDLSAGIVQALDAVAAVLGAFGVGTLSSGKSSSSASAEDAQ